MIRIAEEACDEVISALVGTQEAIGRNYDGAVDMKSSYTLE